jgi:Pyruvate/2-oxoacid:ferredoxin oxidoreductase gamma subunit
VTPLKSKETTREKKSEGKAPPKKQRTEKKGGACDEDLVNPGEIKKGIKACPIKAQRIAETDLGRKIVTNTVIRAFFTALTQAVPKEAMVKGIKTSVPKGTIDLNLKTFERGYDAY